MPKLTVQQRAALMLALQAERVAVDRRLICAYGNRFFMAGRTEPEGTAERSTLRSLEKRGLVAYEPGLSGRGEFTITAEGAKLALTLIDWGKKETN